MKTTVVSPKGNFHKQIKSHEFTWEQLRDVLTKAGAKNVVEDLHGKVREHLLGELIIIGTRYYVSFNSDDDYCWFMLRYL